MVPRAIVDDPHLVTERLKHVLKRARMEDHVDYMDVTYYFIIDYGDGVVYASSNN